MEWEEANMINYDTYIMSARQKITYSLFFIAIVFLMAYIFYHSIFISLLICPSGVLYLKYKKTALINARKKELNIEFKELLASLASSLSAGKSIERAFESSIDDLLILYPDGEADIIKETKIIISRLSLNTPIEEALSDFALRSGIADIKNFSDVIYTSKRTGGNLVQAVKNAAAIINDKIEIKQEIDTMLAARKFEQKVLNILPIGIILVLSTTSWEYMQPVFTTAIGRVVMTVCMLMIALSWLISSKIMNIKF